MEKSILIISASDSSAGAGMQADLKTASLFQIYAFTSLTSLTIQNSNGVVSSMPVPVDFMISQIETALSEIRPEAVKIGLLPSSLHAIALGRILEKHQLGNVIVDPVLSPTAGAEFIDSPYSLIRAYTSHIFPFSTLVTPNIKETSEILNLINPGLSYDMQQGGIFLSRHYPNTSFLIKGGDVDSDTCSDFLFRKEGDEIVKSGFSSPRIDSDNLHGTGCVLSTAIASLIAQGFSLHKAIAKAKEFITFAIERGKNSSPYESGYGPLYLFK